MKEIEITTNKMNPHIDPVLSVWGWEVPLDLFLGGLTAGLLIIACVVIVAGKEERYPTGAYKLCLWAPIFLGIGMIALMLDLSHKPYLWRFYTTFQVTSPMSWGSWTILYVSVVGGFLALGTLRRGYPGFFAFLRRLMPGAIERLFIVFVEFSERNLRLLAKLGIPGAILLGTYTGVLLGTVGARPFWSSSLMGPAFLVSAVASALAFGILITGEGEERLVYRRLLIGFVLFQLLLVALILITMISSGSLKQEAAHLVLGGELSNPFWLSVVLFGMIIPILLEFLLMKGCFFRRLSFVSPVLVLIGGYMFRDVVVEAGQLTGWIPY